MFKHHSSTDNTLERFRRCGLAGNVTRDKLPELKNSAISSFLSVSCLSLKIKLKLYLPSLAAILPCFHVVVLIWDDEPK